MQDRLKRPLRRPRNGPEQLRNDLDQQQVKSALGHRIAETIRSNGLVQATAAEALGIDQPKVSRLMSMRLDEFSTSRLSRFLALLGSDVEIVVRPPAPSPERATGRLSVVDKRQSI